jgi:hypothetical protein
MDPDMSKYDLEHITTAHPIMSREEWTGAYYDAWKRFYSDAHIETILRRAIKDGIKPYKVLDTVTLFAGSMPIEGVHPLQFGLVRRKVRTQRRHGLPLESPLVFYPRRIVESAVTTAKWLRLLLRYRRILWRILADPTRANYIDEALRPSAGEEAEREIVRTYADKIPQHAHGAPARASAV